MSVFCLLTLFFTSLPSYGSPSAPLVLQVGGAAFLPVPTGQGVDVYGKSIIKVDSLGEQFLVTGKKIGNTRIRVGPSTTPVYVLRRPLVRTYRKLKKWLQGRRGPHIEVSIDQVKLVGRFLVLKDLISLQRLTLNGKSWVNRAQLTDALKLQVKQYIDQQIKYQNLAPGKLNFTPFWRYDISKEQGNQIKLYEKVLSPFGIKTQVNTNSLSQRPMVEIRLYICQASQRFFRHYGLQWPHAATGQVVGNGLSNQINYSLEFSSHHLEQQGLAKVLATPTLVTQSHNKANFHSGGEFPVIANRSLFAQVEWKKHGILLDIEPKIDQQNNLQIKINAEISLLDQGHAPNGIPAIDKSQVSTTFFLKQPRPIVLSGLVKKRWYNRREGLPWLSQIPLLNTLFAHKENLNSEADIVFIVVPKIL